MITKEPVSPTSLGAADFALARDGSLVYLSGIAATSGVQRTLVWVDRQGHETPIAAPPRNYVYPRLSPDGARVAVYAGDQESDIWVWDLSRTTLTRATFDPGVDSFPVWTPDGRRLIFSSDRAGAGNLFWQAADGTGAVERLTDSPNFQAATAVSPDGRRLIFTELTPKTGDDVMQVELDGTHRVTPLVQSPFSERNGIVSPDGRWLAYEANDSAGTRSTSGRILTSTAAIGRCPPSAARGRSGRSTGRNSFTSRRPARSCASAWSAARRGWRRRRRCWSRKGISRRRTPIPGARTTSHPTASGFSGSRTPARTRPPRRRRLIVVQHWTEELKRLVPTK